MSPMGEDRRYEIWCDKADGEPFLIGWADHEDAFKTAVENHPTWTNHRAIDKWANPKAE